jgi:hypothetical protein
MRRPRSIAQRAYVWLAAGLLAVATLMPLSVQAAHAATPVLVTVPIEVNLLLPTCDDAIVLSATGWVKVSVRSGNGALTEVLIERIHVRETYRNQRTGATLSAVVTGIDTLATRRDGTLIETEAGLFGRIVVPGRGLVAIDAGYLRLTFAPGDLTPQVQLSGPHDPLDTLLCDTLPDS